MNVHGCFPIKLYLQKQMVGQIWPAGCEFLTTDQTIGKTEDLGCVVLENRFGF